MSSMINITIEICEACEGTGKIQRFERTSGHDGELKYDLCMRCEGSGRELVTITREPLRPR